MDYELKIGQTYIYTPTESICAQNIWNISIAESVNKSSRVIGHIKTNENVFIIQILGIQYNKMDHKTAYDVRILHKNTIGWIYFIKEYFSYLASITEKQI